VKTRKKFGEILLEAGVITEKVLEEALNLQKKSGLALGRILEDLGAISDLDIVAILARQFNLQSMQSIPCPDSPETLFGLVDWELAIKNVVFPLSAENDVLKLAISNPLDFNTLDKIAFRTGMRVETVLATPSAIFKAIKTSYLFEHPGDYSRRKNLLLIFPHDPPPEGLCSRLELAGYLPAAAGSLAEGIELASRNEPDLILFGAGHNQQKERGDFLILRFDQTTADKPVLAVATREDPEEEAFLLELGYFDVLTRPVDFIRLLARIQRALRFYYKPMSPAASSQYLTSFCRPGQMA
jgi:CheY-like chemotaxis protein